LPGAPPPAPSRCCFDADGKAFDRILVSDAIARGLSGLKLESVSVLWHRHGKGPERRLCTDHFPVVVNLRCEQR